jgi:hypothetical protein
MTRNLWTRKNFVLIATIVTLVGVAALLSVGLAYPEPIPDAALGADWQCSRLAFVLTTCTRVRQSAQRVPVSARKDPACLRRG